MIAKQLYLQHIDSIKFQEVLEVRVNQSALNKNFQIIASCLSKINDLSLHIKNCEQEIGGLKSRTTKTEGQIGTLNKSIQLRKQFDLNKIIQCIQEHENKIVSLNQTTTKHTADIDKLYDLAKYLDYNEIVKNIDNLQFFARVKQTDEFAKTTHQRIEELSRQKMDADKCEKELRKCVQHSSYKSFYEDTSRQLIRIEKQKLSHVQFAVAAQSEKTLVLEQRMGQINTNFEQLTKQVDDNSKLVMSIDLKDIEQKIKKAKEELQYQINSIRPAVNSKISLSELEEFQKQMTAKLENFQQNAMETLAEKSETKKALVFLERRINELVKLFHKSSDDPQKQQELEAMLTKTNPFHCASCSANLGRMSGRVSGFAAWSNFPLREHIHEKDKNFDNFVEKLAMKRLSEPFMTKTNAEEKLEQLADVLTNIKQRDNDDPGTTRATNFMHGYGRSESKSSLKDRRPTALSDKKRVETRRFSQRNRQDVKEE